MLLSRNEMIDFILNNVNADKKLTAKENYELLTKLNNATTEELIKEVAFYKEFKI